MSITKDAEWVGMQKISEIVGITLKEMSGFAKPGMSTKQLDDFGGKILSSFGAVSAPRLCFELIKARIDIISYNVFLIQRH